MDEADRIEAYARALLEVARAEGMLGEVEDDLFRFARVFEGNDDLRMALTDPSLPTDRRMAVVEELMGGDMADGSRARHRQAQGRHGRRVRHLGD